MGTIRPSMNTLQVLTTHFATTRAFGWGREGGGEVLRIVRVGFIFDTRVPSRAVLQFFFCLFHYFALLHSTGVAPAKCFALYCTVVTAARFFLWLCFLPDLFLCFNLDPTYLNPAVTIIREAYGWNGGTAWERCSLSTRFSAISGLQTYVPKPFHVDGILCGILAFRYKKVGYLRYAVIASISFQAFHVPFRQVFRAVQEGYCIDGNRWFLRPLVTSTTSSVGLYHVSGLSRCCTFVPSTKLCNVTFP